MPAVLNAISSMSGAARMVKRELDSFRVEFDETVQQLRTDIEDHRAPGSGQGDLEVLGEIRPHIETLGWLMQRVETVRFEMLNELRYGQRPDGRTVLEPRVVNPEALERSPLRLNIGAGHIPFDDYVNVDMRELPGIDVVATVDDLPFEPSTRRRDLQQPHARALPRGGAAPPAAPVLGVAAEAGRHHHDGRAGRRGDGRRTTQRGEMPFEDFREVLYGAQEYEGDTHFTGFTPGSFCELLREAGFVEPVIVASDRRNGKCKEFEITARKAE